MSQQTSGRRMKIGFSPAIHGVAGSGQMPRFRDLQAQARAAEQIGLDSLWVADHVVWPFPNQEEKGCWEAFTFLSGLAAVTSHIQLGPLVACTSFRNPALLAKMADSLDEISDGRFILGLGAGWSELEYRAFGYPFDHLASRFEEALQIIVPLLRQGQVDFAGKYYQACEAVLRPRGPSRSGPPIWIGGSKPRLLELTARYADGWNRAWLPRAAQIAEEYPRLLEACQKVGRDPATLEVTVGTAVELLAPGQQPKADTQWITGSAEHIAEELRAFAKAGVTHLIVSLEPEGVASIEQFARVLEILNQG
jgi:probable F420-dependent oxidoreductase